MKINIQSKYANFAAKNTDQFIGYEAGQFDGTSATFDTIADWIEEDVNAGTFDPKRYIEVLREQAKRPFISVVNRKTK